MNKNQNLLDKPTIIWIDKYIYTLKKIQKLQYLELYPDNIIINNSNNNYSETQINIFTHDLPDKNEKFYYKAFSEKKMAINYIISELKFIETIIIVDENIFIDFVKEFDKNLTKINVIPKIYLYSQNRRVPELPKEIQNQQFYLYNIVYELEDIPKILSVLKEKNTIQETTGFSQTISKQNTQIELIFEQIKNEKELVLPTYCKIFLDGSKPDNYKFINEMYEKYKNDKCRYYKELLGPIKDIQDIPVELLSKYYIKMYTAEGNFYPK